MKPQSISRENSIQGKINSTDKCGLFNHIKHMLAWQAGADLAAEKSFSPRVCHAIICHNWTKGIPCDITLDKALICVDPLTGLITAGALLLPDKKLAG